MARLKITEDPGHGGRDPGAVGPTGLKESDVALNVCKHLAAYLSPFAEVYMTRWINKELGATEKADLQARCDQANSVKADLFISIHCNSADNPAARGMEVYTLPGDGPSDKLAEEIVRAWEAAIPEVPVRKDLADGDSDKEANFYVLRKTAMPAVLVELGFLSNPEEEKLLADGIFQSKCAETIASGVKKFLQIEGEKMADMEAWKQLIMEWGQDKLGLDKAHQADDPTPKWFTIAVAQRAYDLAKQDLINEIIRRLNKA
jgi:N-acetylmuramoyl-L-alanine amidase